MEKPRVDPGALLIAVFAVGVGPHLQSGNWAPNNSIIAVIVLLVVLCYLAPEPGISWRHLMAFNLVVAFIFGVAAAWPAQSLFHLAGVDIDQAERYATNTALGLALLAIPSFFAFRSWHRRQVADGQTNNEAAANGKTAVESTSSASVSPEQG